VLKCVCGSVFYSSVFNAVEKVSVTLWFQRLQRLVLRSVFVCFHRPAFCGVCVHTVDFVSAHKQKIKMKLNLQVRKSQTSLKNARNLKKFKSEVMTTFFFNSAKCTNFEVLVSNFKSRVSRFLMKSRSRLEILTRSRSQLHHWSQITQKHTICFELNRYELRWLWWSVKSFSDLYILQTNTSVAAEGCGYVESDEIEVPFTHLPKFHISDHMEFLKSNGVEVWLVFSLW